MINYPSSCGLEDFPRHNSILEGRIGSKLKSAKTLNELQLRIKVWEFFTC